MELQVNNSLVVECHLVCKFWLHCALGDRIRCTSQLLLLWWTWIRNRCWHVVDTSRSQCRSLFLFFVSFLSEFSIFAYCLSVSLSFALLSVHFSLNSFSFLISASFPCFVTLLLPAHPCPLLTCPSSFLSFPLFAFLYLRSLKISVTSLRKYLLSHIWRILTCWHCEFWLLGL